MINYIFQTKMIRHTNTGYCLSIPKPGDPAMPILLSCDTHSLGQKWIMQSKFKWQAS